ncbi:hypothetical protein PC116_g5737 [Phytophthora cactorum]|nr:hypothetical protein Pcac1_g27253 [Phytophthora cactorum]KAG3196328.1 hypothetical protein PC128_g7729 [Phytophthora cactorum]KAG4054117.1 hypothetical protein PC123_g10770 [Phytophthora cactorum]KAG4246510.1 hypothetical protein PC116_g5737 [Phytophthora cactorum]
MPGQRVAFDIAKKKEAIIWIRVHGGGVASRAEAHFRAKWWRRAPEEVVMSSIYGCGLDDDFEEWFISKHDAYGDLFQTKWPLCDQNPVSAADEYDDDVSMALDELVIE